MIDIDGDDVRILETPGEVKARILLCDYNPTIPYWLDSRGGPQPGASIVNVVNAGAQAGYTLLGATLTKGHLGRRQSRGPLRRHRDMPRVAPADLYTNVLFDFTGRVQVVGRIPFGVRVGKTQFAHGGPLTPTEAARSLVVLPSPRAMAARLTGALRRRLPSPRSRSDRVLDSDDVQAEAQD